MDLQKNEKLIAFCLLGAGVLFLASLVMFHTPENEMALRIVDAAVGGLLLALGGASNALFRSKSDEVAEKAVDKLPPPTGEAAFGAMIQDDQLSPANISGRLSIGDLGIVDEGAAPWTK